MMGFVKLSREVLVELRTKGYNALRSCDHDGNNDPSWVPDQLGKKFVEFSYIKIGRHQFMLIENALVNYDEARFTGMVFIEN
ncbi:hypothetical protein HP439_13745 [Sphingobacterium shayense]|uniref:hypothetical protein n=1 Tax=Sphingobacterium shayense TaxID=626343 RepID=UPI001555DE65|nr:hypothetical protein [Sphingobacterium shayense]NQD71786.1 hypothetical protein [Sphingobacterium shayense]